MYLHTYFCVTTMLKSDISKSVQSYVIHISKEANKSSKNRNVNWDVYISTKYCELII